MTLFRQGLHQISGERTEVVRRGAWCAALVHVPEDLGRAMGLGWPWGGV